MRRTNHAFVELCLTFIVCGHRSKYGTPTISILCSATGVIFLSSLSFQEIIEFLNFLYALGMLLEFAAFVKLRIKKPDLNRPYRVPLNTFGTLSLCLPPSLLVILVMVLAAPKTFLISGVIIVVGFCLYPFLELVKEKRWARFIPEDPRRQVLGVQTESQLDEEHGDESSASLLP